MVKCVHFYLLPVMIYAMIARLPQANALQSIKKQIFNNNGLGSYSFEFETFDGTYRKEDGALVEDVKGLNSLAVRGEYGYIDPDGLSRVIRYVADINGYRLQHNDDDIRFNDRRII